MEKPLPLTRDLVLIGGGHAHALVLRAWGMRPLPGARLTVINPGPTAPYTGMLPGFIAGHYQRDELEIDLLRLCRFAGARLILGSATGIDRGARLVQVSGRPDLRYDVASIDIGITSDMPNIPGFAEHGIAAKPLGRYAGEWERFLVDVAAGRVPPQVCVIGGGVAGVELALAMAHRLRAAGQIPQMTVLDRSTALAGMGGTARALLFEQVRTAGIAVREQCSVERITATHVHPVGAGPIPSAFTLGAAGARPHGWLADLGLAHEGGYLTVDPYLRSVSDPAIYVAGDCAHMGFAPRPKAGVFAVRQAPVLHTNLRADLGRGARRAYHPQRDFLKLISLGGKEALAHYYGLVPRGAALWRLKDKIDRDFMEKVGTLPAMPRPVPPIDAARGVGAMLRDTPLCGGCGAKIGGAALRGALAGLPSPQRADVLSRPGDDAAILAHGPEGRGWQVMTTDHLRAFTLDPVLHTRITAIHALGDIWAMGADPQAATATVILPEMAPALMQATLAEVMAEAAQVMRAAGADLVGGHSSVGSEMTIGFTITGLASRPPITVAGAQPGDALLLTKPIGSGTLLAAEMRMLAKGNDMAALYAALSQGQGAAARCLADAHAMTDVTGFGLAGHLAAICEASGCGAEVILNDVQVYPGALELAARGIRSSLYPANRASLMGRVQAPDTDLAALMFDPQTAGGLLAAVAPETVNDVQKALHKAGGAAVRIGTVTKADAGIILR